jgi:hypothetical protein
MRALTSNTFEHHLSTMHATHETDKPPYFYLFSQLPTELRLKVWKYALPGPRLVELTVQSPERPDIEYGTTQSSAQNLRWLWVINNAKSPALLYVSHEAREVALGSYEATGAWEPSFRPWRKAYINYSADTLYFSALTYRALLFSRRGAHSKFDKKSINLSRIRSLALASWPRIRQSVEPILRTEAVHLLQFVLKSCQGLEELFLTMDGRVSIFEGPDRLEEPTERYPDYSDGVTKEKMLKLIDEMVEEAQELEPTVKLPLVRLKLLMNGPDTLAVERRWFYGRGCCETYALERPLRPLGKNAYEYIFD